MKKKATEKDAFEAIADEIRRLVVEMAYNSKTSHIGSALSISDILAILYFKILQINPKRPGDSNRDRFILSKGHAAAALYAVLALRRYFPKSELKKYCTVGGRFHGHPCSEDAPGIEFSTGSLGHGLPVGAGIALGLAQKKAKVYVLMGDGECNEGTVWEAALFASTHNLKNLIAIIDRNGFQGFGASQNVHPMKLEEKFMAFDWNVRTVDGHNLQELEEALEGLSENQRPTVIIANTVSGKSVPHIENTLLAHYYVPDEKTYREVMKKNA